MRILSKDTVPSLILVTALVLILAVLAVLQYRWSGEVGEATHERMHTSLLASMNQFRRQLNDEFQQIMFLLRPDLAVLARKDWNSYAESCSAALNVSNARLVRDIYLLTPSGDGSSRLLRLDRGFKAFQPASWPPQLQPVQDRYSRLQSNPREPAPEMLPFYTTIQWRIPLLSQPLYALRPGANDAPPGGNPEFVGHVMVELNDTIRTELLPELARECFEGPEGFIYHIAVVVGRGTKAAVYISDPALRLQDFAQSDARLALEDIPQEPGGGGPPPDAGRPLTSPASPAAPDSQFRAQGQNPLPPARDNPDFRWELVAKHREGSLEKAVARMRWRNLAMVFGILLLLGFSMALIIVYARRAQRLARLQIDFVAGISHELRTPLSVICSAGDNLAAGVVPDSGSSARKYGELIRSEGRKLAEMIEHILQFASLRRGGQLNLRTADLNMIAASALERSRPLIDKRGISVETSFAPGLPPVKVDRSALSRAIQNLIENAVKYSGESRWIAIRTDQVDGRKGREVRVVIEDRGIGIGHDDLPHIFDSFYRGRAAIDAQIHGTGLGLFVANAGVQQMGGRITVESTPGKRTAFAIHFPALPEAAPEFLAAARGESRDEV